MTAVRKAVWNKAVYHLTRKSKNRHRKLAKKKEIVFN